MMCARCEALKEIERIEKRAAKLRVAYGLVDKDTFEKLTYFGVPLRDVFLFISAELEAGRRPWDRKPTDVVADVAADRAKHGDGPKLLPPPKVSCE